MKSFIKNHPYLFFELLGVGLIVVDFAYVFVAALVGIENINYLFIFLIGLIGFLLITLSPLCILIVRNSKKYTAHWDRIIMHLYAMEKGNKLGYIIGFTLVGIAILAAVAMLVVGEEISMLLGIVIFILSFYFDALLFKIYRKSIISKFYKVKNAYEKIRILEVKDTAFLDELYKDSSLTFAIKPDVEFLNFIYNWLNNKGLLKEECVNLFVVTGKDIREKYESILIDDNDVLLCIMMGDLSFNEENSKDFSQQRFIVGGRYFDILVDKSIQWIECALCNLGRLVFCTEIETGTVFLACDVCETYFDTPEDAFNLIPSAKEYIKIRKATPDEIKNSGLGNFIKHDHWTIKDAKSHLIKPNKKFK